MKWYEEHFFNRRDWILEHLDMLTLSANETVLVLLMDYLNQYQIPITIETLKNRSNLTEEEVNQTIASLCTKNYLEIKASSGNVRFLLNGLFETDVTHAKNILDSSLFDLFESELNKALTPNEMNKISEWNRNTDKQMIIYALRRASALDKKSINYIDTIISNWKQKNVTLKMIEEGKA